MHKASLILSAPALSLQNVGAIAATDGLGNWTSQPTTAPHPVLVAVFALIAASASLRMA